MDTRSRIESLYGDLSNFEAGASVGWQVGVIFNALLEQAKKDHSGDPVIAALEPVQQSGGSGSAIANMNAGTLRVAVGQLLDAYPQPGPAIG